MLKKKSCIYDIIEWMGVVCKYTGCIPLPGVYEKREWSKWTKGFINYVIPSLNFGTFLLYYFVPELYSNYYNNLVRPTDLTGWLLHLVMVAYSVHLFTCTVFNHFYLRRELVTYLKLHSSVEHLLQLKTRQLKRVVCVFFVILIVFHTFQETLSCIMEGSLKEYFQYCCENPSEIITALSGAFIFSIGVRTHPYLMYFIFQRVLTSSFDQLLEKIKKKQNKNLSGEKRVKKMRKYMRLYRDLCELCSRLDHMVSPLMLIIFMKHYLNAINSFAFILIYGVVNVETAVEIVSGFFVLFFVSNFAYFTKNYHDKILPAIFYTFNSDEKAVKTELENFSLQSMYFNKAFSASGFFKLDRELILAIFNSLISQVVVFYKILQERERLLEQKVLDQQTLWHTSDQQTSTTI